MNDESLSRDLYGFATELRQLAYTMPGGHEDPLVRLSERMIRYAQEEATEPHRVKALCRPPGLGHKTAGTWVLLLA
jgi:hypothetical protein